MKLGRADLLGPTFYIVALKLAVVSYSFLNMAFVSAKASIKFGKCLKGLFAFTLSTL